MRPTMLPSALCDRWWWRARTGVGIDRKSTRLNSSHSQISYAVFCLKKKKMYTAELVAMLLVAAVSADVDVVNQPAEGVLVPVGQKVIHTYPPLADVGTYTAVRTTLL